MKRMIALATLLSMVLAGVAVAQSYKDGVYFAQQSAYSSSGWRYQAVITVKGGKIVKAEWNAVSNLGVVDKKAYAAAGKYGMAKIAKNGEWDVQAAKVEAALVAAGSPDKIAVKADGKTDAIAGASITVKEFIELAKVALASKPVEKGGYKKDGWYFAEAAAFETSGWKDNVLLTVVNGRIVDVLWNGTYKDATKKSKLVEAAAGRYGMAKVAKKGEWNVQTAAMEAALLAAQDPSKIAVKADGKTDAVSGASITVKGFLDLCAQALKAAK